MKANEWKEKKKRKIFNIKQTIANSAQYSQTITECFISNSVYCLNGKQETDLAIITALTLLILNIQV